MLNNYENQNKQNANNSNSKLNKFQKENEECKESNLKNKDEIVQLNKDDSTIDYLVKKDQINQDLMIDLFS